MQAIITIIIALALSFGLTFIARRLAPRLGFVDRPDGKRKTHARAVPVLGGAAIYFTLLAMYVGNAVLQGEGLGTQVNTTAMMASCTLFFFLGLVDDIRPLRPRHKFIGQILASVPFVLMGTSIESIHLFGFSMELGYLGIAFTILWLVTCSNIVNLVDGLDGLASSIGIIVLSTVAVLCWMHGAPEVGMMVAVIAAAILGFLVHNWPPAKIFLGDAGSLMIGFLVGACAIESSLKRATVFTIVASLVLVSVPFFDTMMAMLRRKLRGRGIGEADRGHIHHRLQDLGLSRTQTLLVIIVLSIAMSCTTIVADYVGSEFVALIACFALLASLVVCRVFGHYEAIMLVRHTRAVSSLFVEALRMVSSRVLMVRLQDSEVTGEQDAWKLIDDRLTTLGVVSLNFMAFDREKNLKGELTWMKDSALSSREEEWVLNFSARIDLDTTTMITAKGDAGEKIAVQGGSDLFNFCDSLCRNSVVIELAEKSYALKQGGLPFQRLTSKKQEGKDLLLESQDDNSTSSSSKRAA